MTFKTNLAGPGRTGLSGTSLLELRGPGAVAFAQAQFMNDVAALAPGRWQWNGWLTPKGRVVALFALLRLDEETLWLVLPDFPAGELLPLLRRFVFRSKLALRVVEETVCAAGPEADVPEADRIVTEPESGARALDLGGEGGPRWLWLVPADAAAPPDPALDAAWRAADIAHGLPRLDASQREAWTPQMLSLQRLAAFSVRKGCYPGQEIVARTHFLGQAKRGLARLGGDGLAPGQAVESAGVSAGTVICVALGGAEALAVLSVDADAPRVAASGPCRRLPLLGGLQRPR